MPISEEYKKKKIVGGIDLIFILDRQLKKLLKVKDVNVVEQSREIRELAKLITDLGSEADADLKDKSDSFKDKIARLSDG